MYALIGAAIAGSMVLAAAEPVPAFDAAPSCRAAASRALAPDYAATCMREEQQARAEIERLWPQFNSADKAYCVPLSTLGGNPTYTELLTCLQLARDARALRHPTAPVTTGAGRCMVRMERARAGSQSIGAAFGAAVPHPGRCRTHSPGKSRQLR
jgi:hypothetical protein